MSYAEREYINISITLLLHCSGNVAGRVYTIHDSVEIPFELDVGQFTDDTQGEPELEIQSIPNACSSLL